VEFQIPAHWVEEYEEDGGGTFYEPTPDSDTLRLSVLTLRTASAVTSATPFELLRPRAEKYGTTAVPLANGNAVITYSVPADEDGVALIIRYWEVANIVPPAHARIAIFSFTMRATEQTRASRDLQWIDREARALRFSTELGVVAG
jgi:hypothetical protein